MPSKVYDLCRSRYIDDFGNPFELAPNQEIIFSSIFKRQYQGKRNIHCITFTRYGKSVTVALAVLTRITTYAEKWVIVAPTDKKARIIIGYIIQHIFDNDLTTKQFKIGKNESEERIRREKSKEKLTFRVGSSGIGEVFVISTQERLHKNPLDALLGFGAPNIIIDESSLIDDIKHAGILRMLGDMPEPFLFEIGNAVRRNHFFIDSNFSDKEKRKEKYYHIWVDYRMGLKEERITQEQVDRMRDKPEFEMLYGSKFPSGDIMDREGWMSLLTYEEIKQARRRTVQPSGAERMGVDVGEGGDPSVITGRTLNYARIIQIDHEPDVTKTAGTIRNFLMTEGIKDKNVMIDDIGNNVTAICREKGALVWGVKVSMTADEPQKYRNLKAEVYMRLRNWIRAGGCLEDRDEWEELSDVKYRTIDSYGKTEIMSKSKMDISPNVAESLAMTFYRALNIDDHDQSVEMYVEQDEGGSY